MKFLSYPRIVVLGARGTAAEGNDLKRYWLSRCKTNVPVIVSNFFPGFISDSIVSMLCTLAF